MKSIGISCLAIIAWLATSNLLTAQSELQSANDSRLKTLFEDNFESSSLSNYEVTGSAKIAESSLAIPKGCSLRKEVSASRVVNVALEMEENPFSFELGLEVPGIRMYLAKCDYNESKEQIELTLIDQGLGPGEKKTARKMNSRTLGVAEIKSIELEYRYGLITISANGQAALYGVTEKLDQTPATFILANKGHDMIVKRIEVKHDPATIREINEAQRKELQKIAEVEPLMQPALQQGNHARALELVERVKSVKRAVFGPQSPEFAGALGDEATIYQATGKSAIAKETYNKAMEIQLRALGPNHPGIEESLKGLTLACESLGEFQQAENHARRGISILENCHGTKHPRYAEALNGLAFVLDSIGAYADAEPLYRTAASIIESEYGRKSIEFLLVANNLAAANYNLGNYEVAAKYYELSLGAIKALIGSENPSYATVLNNLALLHSRTGNYVEAEQQFKECLRLLKASFGEQHPNYSECLSSLALMYYEMRRFDVALELAVKAKDLKLKALGEHHPRYATGLNTLALVHCGMGEFEEAESLFQEAAEIVKASLGELHPTYAQMRNDLGLVFHGSGKYTEAVKAFDVADKIKVKTIGKDHFDRAVTLINRAGVHYEEDRFDKAYRDFVEATSLARHHLARNSLIQSERQQKSNQLSNRFYLNWGISIAHHNGNAASVIEEIWKWKGATTLRQGAYREIATNTELAPKFTELKQVTQRLSALSRRLPIQGMQNQKTFRDAKSDWERSFTELNRQREKLEQDIAKASSSYRDIQSPITVAEVQKNLPPETALVDFLEFNHAGFKPNPIGRIPFERRFVAVVVRSDRDPTLVLLGNAGEISQDVFDFREGLTANSVANHDRLNSASKRLRDKLWNPIEQHLEGVNTIVISPDTTLGTLPFSALPSKRTGHFLIEDYRIVQIPFANLIPKLATATKDKRAASNLLVVGDIDYGVSGNTGKQNDIPEDEQLSESKKTRSNLGIRQWDSLPGFRDELGIIKAIHSKAYGEQATTKTLVGKAATESALLESTGNFNTIHLITHGFFEDPGVRSINQAMSQEAPLSISGPQRTDQFVNTWMPGLLSGLVLAGANEFEDSLENDGILRASEIEVASMQGVDLVVLSACETGLGPVAGGEGLSGLQRAFHMAGAKSCISSLWKVDDLATLELMRRFYSNYWIKKMSKLDSLREAQIWMLNHPKEIQELGVKNPQLRGEPRKLRTASDVEPRNRTTQRTDPYFWAAFVLSGDWR